MIDITLIPQAYREVIEILKYIPKIEYNKLPNELISKMEKEQDKNHQYNIDMFKNNEMLKETEIILTVLFREYLATPEQKIKIFKILFKKKRKEKSTI